MVMSLSTLKSHTPMLLISAVSVILGPAIVIPGCATPEDELPAYAYDLDISPEDLEELEGKMDASSACEGHPGGTLAGDDLMVIITKEELRQLQAGWQPIDLVPIEAGHMIPGREGMARLAAVQSFAELRQAAADEAGLDLRVRSAYRSYSTQCYTFNYWVENKGYEHALRHSAMPGRSEHQLGTAIDITAASINWELEEELAATVEGIWLAENAYRFGFGLSYPDGEEELTGYGYEPWHWRYIGRDAALEMHESGMILIEYLLQCEAGNADLTCPHEEPPEIVVNEGFIGGTCEDRSECLSMGDDADCLLDGYPDGQCTLPCTRGCPDRDGSYVETFCVEEYAGAAIGYCHSKCDTSYYPEGGCRQGYSCLQGSRPENGGTSFVCLPES